MPVQRVVTLDAATAQRIADTVRTVERSNGVDLTGQRLNTSPRSIDDYWVRVTNTTLSGAFYPGVRCEWDGSDVADTAEVVKVFAVEGVPALERYRARRHTYDGSAMVYSIRVESVTGSFENSTLNNTTLNGNTVVENLTVEEYTLLETEVDINANVTIGGGFLLTFAGNVTKQHNGTYTNETFEGDVYETYNGNITKTIGANKTYTICGNTTICANKTLTLPEIVGNGGGGTLVKMRPGTGNAAVPGQIQLLNGVVELTDITGTPTTPANGTYGLFVDNGTLTLVDSTGAEYPVANTGNGTSNGSLGWVQYADGSGGFSATAGIAIDGANDTLYAETMKVSTLASGPYLVYAGSVDGELSPVTAISPTYVLFADANGLPTGHPDLTFDAANGTLYAETVRISGSGSGNRVVISDNDGDLVPSQGSAVANATGSGDAHTQLNALLAELRSLGIIDT